MDHHFHHTTTSSFLHSHTSNNTINYDFENENNSAKWKSLFVSSLRKILYSVHSDLEVKDEALIFIESLIFKLISLLINNASHNVQELEDRVLKLFPHPIDKWATSKGASVLQECFEAQWNATSAINASNTLGGGKKKKLLLVNIPNNNSNNNSSNWISNCSLITTPIIEKIHDLFSKEVFPYKIDIQLTIYLCSIIEYIAADILKLAGNYVRNMRHDEIYLQDVKIAMNADKVLIDLFYGDSDDKQEISNISTSLDENEDISNDEEGLSYNNVVKELIHEEKQFIRDLELIIKVFREPFIKLLQNSSQPNTPTSLCQEELPLISKEDIDDIFSNILDVYDFSVDFLGIIEDTAEMNEEGEGIGTCFEEMAESAEFEVFGKYTEDMFRVEENSNESIPNSKLSLLLKQQPIINCLDTGGHKFLLSIKYILPKLLLSPVVHCILYFDYIRLLMSLAVSKADKDCFQQAEGVMKLIKFKVEKITKGKNLKINEGYLRLAKTHQRSKKGSFLKKKIKEMKKMIDGFDCTCLGNDCNEFIFEGFLHKLRRNDRKTLGRHDNRLLSSERYCFLFDSLLICCKPLPRETNRDANLPEYKLKEKFFIRNIEMIESDLDFYAFEIIFPPKANNFDSNKNGIILLAKSLEEKNIWISNLLFLSRKTILERTLDSRLLEESKKNPLKLPSPSMYIFAEKDTNDNIIFESNCRNNLLIKGATLTKLIERLTFHQPMDPMFVKIFLTSYRSFCSSQRLLSLLIQRFDIPCDNEDWTREENKKFKKEYCNVVQFRVLNVIKHWIDAHFYDFERDPQLLASLKSFLENKVAKERKNMTKWLNVLFKKIERKQEKRSGLGVKILSEIPPPIEYWLMTGKEGSDYEFNLLTVHPLEFARQLTLYEFELYCAVKPSELIGLKWIKEGKEVNSANLLKISKHSNNVTYWLEKEIVKTVNFEERVALVSRIIDILQVLSDLNNFNGILEIISALESACIHRLEHTFNALSIKHKKLIEEMKDLNSDHSKKYCEKLRSINPPCVPFFGLYQTQILHLEEGNNDYIDVDKGLINFSKRRKIAEITTEIQGYQNQPYCLLSYPEIRNFLENLNPIGESQTEKEFTDYLYDQSLLIEPRGAKQPTKGARRWLYLPTLKSPGIKPSSSHHSSHPTSLPSNTTTNPHSTSSSNPTSPTLISPKTPQSTTSDTSVFASVIIGTLPTPAATPSPIYPLSTTTTTPPPLPPRIKNFHQRTNSESSVTSTTATSPTTAPFAFSFNFNSSSLPISPPPPPPPPPRVTRPITSQQLSNIITSTLPDHQLPPPLPPRGIQPFTMPNQAASNSLRQMLPRRNSIETHHFPDLLSNSSYRRNSSSCSTHSQQNQPQLPPKTYKINR